MKKYKTTKELPEWFNPAPDVLIQRYGRNGLIPASIWGKVFRYTKMKHGVCKASIIRMSGELRITPKTFSKYLKKLIEDEFIEDLTPDVEFSTHQYICTEKIHDETKKWLAEKQLKEALLPWADPREIEMRPAGKQVAPGGNNFLPRGDDVPPEQGPGTDKYSNNIASNIEKDIKSEVGETITKSVSPTSQAGISIQESLENNLGAYLPAIEAEGDTDGISRHDYNEEIRIDPRNGKEIVELDDSAQLVPNTSAQEIILKIYNLERFDTVEQKNGFNRGFEEYLENLSMTLYGYEQLIKTLSESANSLDAAIIWIENNQASLRRHALQLKIDNQKRVLDNIKGWENDAKGRQFIQGINNLIDRYSKEIESLSLLLEE